jgi:ammonia channel protein AmtB
MGYIDYGGASIVHIMGGLAGFIGTYLIGPRIGLFGPDKVLAFIHDDILLDDEGNDIAMLYDEIEDQFEK